MQAKDKKALERGFGAVAALAATIGVLATTLTSAPTPVTAAPTSLAVPATTTPSADTTTQSADTTTPPAAQPPSDTQPAAVANTERPDTVTTAVPATVTVAAGTVEEASTIDALTAATDLSDDDAHVLRLYEAFYGRQPDLEGARFWIDQRRSGVPMSEIAGAFAESDEFAATYGDLDDAGFVESAYRNALGRDIDTAGFAFWIVELERGASRESILVFFTASEEFAAAQPASS